MRGRPKKPEIIKNLFVSDFQIPEQDDRSIDAVLSFVADFAPDYIHFVGDILDLTKQSKWDPNPYDKHDLQDELVIAKSILKRFVQAGRKANPNVAFNFLEGNHEARALHRLAKAGDLADLEVDGEYILSLPHLLGLRGMDINWIPYMKGLMIDGHVGVEHGDLARSHASYTAKAMLEKRGHSGFSGHTHRLGIHYKTYGTGLTKFWVETGSLCRLNFQFPYKKDNDWQQGFAIGYYVKETRMMHPYIVPMFNHTFLWNGKIYRG